MIKFKTTLYEYILYPIYQIKLGATFGFKSISMLNQLNISQWWSRDRLRDYQNNKLRRLINHVYQNVPYYRTIMKNKDIRPNDINDVDDLKLFPILDKDIIKNNFDKITSKDINDRRVRKISTSGSTGKPLIFFRDINSLIITDAARLRGWSWANYQVGTPIISSSSSNLTSFLGNARLRIINEREFLGFAKEDHLVNYFDRYKSSKYYFTGFASNLYRIAKILNKHNMNAIRFPAVFSTSEMLYDHQRNFIEKQFDSQVYDYYGCNEIGSMAYECEYKNKHITEEHVIIETDSQHSYQDDTNSGALIITDLDNYAMPFIRYKLGDVGTLTDETCSCGRGLSLMKKVKGRTQDFLVATDGNSVPSIYFPNRFRSLKGIEQYQIIQNDIHHITIKFVKNGQFYSEELDELIKAILEMLGNEVNIMLEEHSYLYITGRDKTRLVISHVAGKHN